MTTRSDRRIHVTARRERERSGVGVRTSRVAGIGKVFTRSLPTANDSNMEKILAWINEIGRFIDHDGMVTALSNDLLDKLDERYRGIIQLGAPTELTITGGSIAVTRTYHVVAGYGGSADNLDTITGGEDGDVLILRPSDEVITVRHAQDNIALNDTDADANGDDCTLSGTRDKLVLVYDAATSNWCEIARADNNQA